MFVPFLLSNCGGEDLPYAIESASSESAGTEVSASENCTSNEFLTADCIESLQSDADEATSNDTDIRTAYDSLTDFQSCQAEESATETETETEEETSSSLDCETIVSSVISGYNVCSQQGSDDKNLFCFDIEDQVDTAADDCDSDSESVTATFCSILG